MMKLGCSCLRLVFVAVVVLAVSVLDVVVTAQDFRSIGIFRSDISAQITTLEFPPYCPESDDDDDNNDAALPQVPANLPVTILPGTANQDVWDIRTTPPDLVHAVFGEDKTLRFFWNPSVLNNDTSTSIISPVGMLIQVPTAAAAADDSTVFQSLVIRDGGVQVQILAGVANQFRRIDMSTSTGISTLDLILEDGDGDNSDTTTTTLLDLTLEGPGTSATIVTNTKNVGNVLVQDDAHLSLNGNIHGSLTIEKATMQWKGEFVLEEEEEESSSATTTTTTPTIASKGLLTTTDASVCQVATLELAGECQVDTALQIEAQVTGALSRSVVVVEQEEATSGNNTTSTSSFQTCVAAPVQKVQSSSAMEVTATSWTRLLGVLVVSIMVAGC